MPDRELDPRVAAVVDTVDVAADTVDAAAVPPTYALSVESATWFYERYLDAAARRNASVAPQRLRRAATPPSHRNASIAPLPACDRSGPTVTSRSR